MKRLDRVDHAHLGTLGVERRADGLEARLREDLDRRRAAEPVCTHLHLRRRLLPGDEEDAALQAHRPQRHQQQRRLADARLAPDEDERRRDEPAPEHAIELGDAGRDPVGLRGLDLDEAERRPAGRDRRYIGGTLLDEGAERPAARALAEPAGGRVTALGARVENGCLGLRHAPSLGTASDAGPCRLCAESPRQARRRPSRSSRVPARETRRAVNAAVPGSR